MKYLQDYIEQEQTELFDRLGAFFAFGNGQFKDGCDKVGATAENKVVSFSSGGYVLSKNLDVLVDGLNDIHDKGIKKDIAENGIKNIIHRELGNYECQITNDYSNALDVLGDYGVTEEQVRIEYKEYYKLCVKNDWF